MMYDQANGLRDLMGSKKQDLQKTKQMKIITVASGKGGVGKSNFTSNLALCMRKRENTPLILDADFGLANIEIILGERPKFNLGQYIKGDCGLLDLVCQSEYGVPFISGGSGVKEMLFLDDHKIASIAQGLQSLEQLTNTLIIDTGAGINEIVMKFSELADDMVVVVTPEPASITDAYALIKTMVKTFSQIPRLHVVVNKAENQKEALEVYQKLNFVAKQFLKTSLNFGGYIPYDDMVFKAVKAQKPVTVYAPKAKASQAYQRICDQLLEVKETKANKANWLDQFVNLFTSK